MIRRTTLLILLFAAACGPRQPADPAAQAANARTLVVPLALGPPPVYALIGYRDRLELTSQQITTLDSIALGVRDRNAPLIDSLESQAYTSTRTPGVLQVGAEQRPLLDQIRANNRAALDAVGAALDAEQKQEVCDLYEQDNRSRRERERRESSRRRRPRGAMADTSMVVRGFSVWPWCRSAAARDSALAR